MLREDGIKLCYFIKFNNVTYEVYDVICPRK